MNSSEVNTHCASLTSKHPVSAKLEESSVSTKLDNSSANLGIAKLEKGSLPKKTQTPQLKCQSRYKRANKRMQFKQSYATITDFQ